MRHNVLLKIFKLKLITVIDHFFRKKGTWTHGFWFWKPLFYQLNYFPSKPPGDWMFKKACIAVSPNGMFKRLSKQISSEVTSFRFTSKNLPNPGDIPPKNCIIVFKVHSFCANRRITLEYVDTFAHVRQTCYCVSLEKCYRIAYNIRIKARRNKHPLHTGKKTYIWYTYSKHSFDKIPVPTKSGVCFW